jgi:16S rRNA (cytidine1402-2'-O)-methyltransferase
VLAKDFNVKSETKSGHRFAPTGVLYLVAMPIGNDEDISARALRVLSEADLIACEDTRRMARILTAHSIRTPTISYFEHNETQRIPELVARLRSGAVIALATDAGTPAISDPGYRLVRSCINAGVRVTAVPGPCAAITALAVAGLPTDRFAFEGFLPVKSGERRRLLAQLATENRTLIIYETARRLPQLLSELVVAFGAQRRVVVVREATKIHEDVARGTAAELVEHFSSGQVLGEVTVLVEGASAPGKLPTSSGLEPSRVVGILLDAGLSLKDASAVASRITGVRRREIYQAAITTKKSDRSGRQG